MYKCDKSREICQRTVTCGHIWWVYRGESVRFCCAAATVLLCDVASGSCARYTILHYKKRKEVATAIINKSQKQFIQLSNNSLFMHK